MPRLRTFPLALSLALLAGMAPVRAQTGSDSLTAAAPRKQARAARVDRGAIHVDGRLDEAAWGGVAFIADLRQKEPVEHGEPSERTEVGFLYDGDALYIGARMFSRDPAAIDRALTRRDQYGDAEHLVVSLDTHQDRRTAYSFSVTASGVRRDYYHPRDTDDHGARDFTFDPVWDAKVHHDSTGWTAEMRIPFSQLRFNDRELQRWGLNLFRWIPARNESDYWVVVPRNETGYASRFGVLTGLDGIRPTRRVEIVPYVATNGRFAGAPDRANPFDPDGRDVAGRAGADFKMGLGPSVTLDATINPDFGQVEADPAEVNLTAFETFFDERRPFFTEGSQLLRSTVNNYFYSRRIGGRPRGTLDGDYVRRPDATTILGAAKLTGRLPSGLSIGALAAVTGREYGQAFDTTTGVLTRAPIEPRAGYGVMRLQQQFGANASTVGAVVSGVTRSFGDDTTLPETMTSRAIAGGADWVLRFKQGMYELSGDVGGSHVSGSRAAILALQQASQRYLQRPDYRYASVDSSRTALNGWRARLRGDKNAGNWLWGAGLELQSPGFETNDMGRVRSADDIDLNADVNYRWTTPGRVFRFANVGIFTRANWNFDGVRTSTLIGLFSRYTWLNFMTSSLNLNVATRGQSDSQTRGGPLMQTPAGVEANVSVSSPFSGALQWRGSANVYRGEIGARQVRIGGGVTLRATPAVSVSIAPSYLRVREPRQYITALPGGSAATYGTRYVFGAIERSTLSAQLRLNYTFAPDLSLEVYAEPFAASGRYSGIGELAAPRGWDLRTYGRDGTTAVETADGLTVTDSRNGETFSVSRPDFNALSFRSNVVLRWEWRPGSTLFLVWQQNRSAFCSTADATDCAGRTPGRLVGPGSLLDTFDATGDNFLAIKATYWLAVR